jgi:urease accessory protein
MATDERLVWQLADSAFPAGALAHSNGLEAAVQSGIVKDRPSLEEFIRVSVRQCVSGVLGFVRAAHQAPAKFKMFDEHCDLFLNNHIANRASRAQGRAFLAATSRIFATASVLDLSTQLRSVHSPTHLAPVFGLALESLEIDLAETERLFLFIFIRGSVSSAVRLGIVGPLEAQQLQWQLKAETQRSETLPVQTAPVLDLLQGTQDRLYSRLFQS